jgi:hypothetical protein
MRPNMLHKTETLDRLRPCDEVLVSDLMYGIVPHRKPDLRYKRALIEAIAWVDDSILTGKLRITIADPHGAMGDGTEVIVWAGTTAEQWWYRGGQRTAPWRGPLHPDYPDA